MNAARSETRVAAGTAVDTTRAGFADAATQPLDDFNITRETIPPTLLAVRYEYEADPAPDCGDVAREIGALNAVLGRDFDQDAEERSAGEAGGEQAGDFVLDVIEDAATGFIPFRGVVREATGAARHDRRLQRAYQSGVARRAFLRGYATALGCRPPAAPRTLTAPDTVEGDPAPIERRETHDARTPHRWGEANQPDD